MRQYRHHNDQSTFKLLGLPAQSSDVSAIRVVALAVPPHPRDNGFKNAETGIAPTAIKNTKTEICLVSERRVFFAISH